MKLKTLSLFCLMVLTAWQGYAQTWQDVGNPAFDGGEHLSLAFNPVTAEPYIAYRSLPSGYLKVKKYANGAWQDVGTLNIIGTLGTNGQSLAFQPGTAIPYLLYKDINEASHVVRYINSSWNNIGSSADFQGSAGALAFNPVTSIAYITTFKNVGSVNVPVLDFLVRKYDGVNWVQVGPVIASNSAANQSYHCLSFSQSGIPYVSYSNQLQTIGITIKNYDQVNNIWQTIGSSSYSNNVWFQSLAIHPLDNNPYVAFCDFDQKTKVIYVSSNNITHVIGNVNNIPVINTSSGDSYFQKMIFNPTTKVPYIGFCNGQNSQKTSVIQYNSVSQIWEPVGSLDVSSFPAAWQSMAFHPLTHEPYIAYTDPLIPANNITVKRFVSPTEINVTGNSLSIADGDMSPRPEDHTDFGAGCAVTRTYTIENTGTATLHITSIKSSDPTAFAIGGIALPAPILPGQSSTFTVTMGAAIAGPHDAIISIYNNDEDESIYDFMTKSIFHISEINITGNSVTIADGDITPDPQDHTYFGAIPCSGTSITRTYTIENTGNCDLTITSLGSSNTVHFTTGGINTFPAIVPPGQTLTFTVTANGNTAGIKTAVITLGNTDTDEAVYDFTVQAQYSAGVLLTNSTSASWGQTYTNTLQQTLFTGTVTWFATPAINHGLTVNANGTITGVPDGRDPANPISAITFQVWVEQNGVTSCTETITIPVACPVFPTNPILHTFQVHQAICGIPGEMISFTVPSPWPNAPSGSVTWTFPPLPAGMYSSISNNTLTISGIPNTPATITLAPFSSFQGCDAPAMDVYQIIVQPCPCPTQWWDMGTPSIATTNQQNNQAPFFHQTLDTYGEAALLCQSYLVSGSGAIGTVYQCSTPTSAWQNTGTLGNTGQPIFTSAEYGIDGTPYALIVQDQTYVKQFAGGTWNTIGTHANITGVHMTVSPNNTVYILNGAGIFKLLPGNTWETLPNPATTMDMPRITTDINNTLYVSYLVPAGGNTKQVAIKRYVKINSNWQWQSITTLSTVNASHHYTRVHTNGDIYVAYRINQGQSNNSRLRVIRYRNNTWTNLGDVSDYEASISGRGNILDVDANGVPYVIYDDRQWNSTVSAVLQDRPVVKRYINNAWEEVGDLGFYNNNFSFTPVIDINSNGNIFASFTNSSMSWVKRYGSCDNPIIITPGSLGNGIVGQPYASAIIGAQGLIGSAQWSAVNLPQGFVLSSINGELRIRNNNPTVAGTFSFVVRISQGGRYATKIYTIIVCPTGGCPPPVGGRLYTGSNHETASPEASQASPGLAETAVAPVQLSPNPVTSHLSLNGGDPEATYGVRLSDIQGKTLGTYQGTLMQVETGLNQQTEALAAGVYFLHVQPEGGKAEVLRFVKVD